MTGTLLIHCECSCASSFTTTPRGRAFLLTFVCSVSFITSIPLVTNDLTALVSNKESENVSAQWCLSVLALFVSSIRTIGLVTASRCWILWYWGQVTAWSTEMCNCWCVYWCNQKNINPSPQQIGTRCHLSHTKIILILYRVINHGHEQSLWLKCNLLQQ